MIKVGTGIGCGIICRGEVYRGATGSAGDVGHICVDQAGPRCRCGNFGCVEAMAAAPAQSAAAEQAEKDQLYKLRHSAAHIMAEAVLR